MKYFLRFFSVLLVFACFAPNWAYALDDTDQDDTYECPEPSEDQLCDIADSLYRDNISLENCTDVCTARCETAIGYNALPNAEATCPSACWVRCEDFCENNNGCFVSTDCPDGRGWGGPGCADEGGEVEDPGEEEGGDCTYSPITGSLSGYEPLDASDITGVCSQYDTPQLIDGSVRTYFRNCLQCAPGNIKITDTVHIEDANCMLTFDTCEEICTPGTVCGDWTSYNDKTESQTCTITADDCETSSTTMYRCKSGYYATGTTPNANPDGLGCISQQDCDAMATIWRDMMNMTAQERITHCTNMGAYTNPPTETGRLCEIVRSNNGVPSQCTVCTPGEECTNWTRISQEFERGACTITAADCSVSQTLKYRCAVGYYATGTSPNATQSGLNCTVCPTMYDNTVPTTTAEGGQTSIAACCVDSVSYPSFSDPKGTFHINGECCWVP